MRRLVALFVVVVALVLVPAALGAPTIRVKGNHLVNGRGKTVRLLGVDRSGAEYACAQGWGFWDGPVDAKEIGRMKSWGINAVRVPLNEACWLGLDSVSPDRRGPAYRSQIEGFVSRLHKAGLYVIVDLHWNAPDDQPALDQAFMADADHSPDFWRSVARTFKNDRGMVFDLYNEPHDISWRCWRDGCTTNDGWEAAGMAGLVDAVRSTGARQPIMLGGLDWAGDLRKWWKWHPTDPRHAEVASFHTYPTADCARSGCWGPLVAGVYRHVPVVTGELGEYDCRASRVTSYMNWADKHGVSYLAWAWNVGPRCSQGPDLIKSYKGTPTGFGAGFRKHLLGLRR